MAVDLEAVSSTFGYREMGTSKEQSGYARELITGPPVESITKREYQDVGAVKSRSLIRRVEFERKQDGGHNSDAVLNDSSVPNKVRNILALYKCILLTN